MDRRDREASASTLADEARAGASRAKAGWREQRLREHLARPIEERLRIALSMIMPASRRERADNR